MSRYKLNDTQRESVSYIPKDLDISHRDIYVEDKTLVIEDYGFQELTDYEVDILLKGGIV